MTDTETKPKTSRRWLLPLLFASLALNLLIAGMFIGNALSRETEGRAARGVVGEPFVRALPREERRALLRDMREHQGRIRESRESLRQRFEAFLAALRSDTFDPDRVKALLVEQRGAALARQEIGEALLLKRLASMTQAERIAYADRLEDALRRFRRR